MFSWFKNKLKLSPQPTAHMPVTEKEIEDAIEESLWEIKDEYDLPTEEIYDVVHTKRKNIDYLHKSVYKRRKQGK